MTSTGLVCRGIEPTLSLQLNIGKMRNELQPTAAPICDALLVKLLSHEFSGLTPELSRPVAGRRLGASVAEKHSGGAPMRVRLERIVRAQVTGATGATEQLTESRANRAQPEDAAGKRGLGPGPNRQPVAARRTARRASQIRKESERQDGDAAAMPKARRTRSGTLR